VTFSENDSTKSNNNEVIERKRSGNNPTGNILKSMGIDLSDIQIKIALKEEDKALIKESIDNMSKDVKKYWTRTHILMVAIAVGSALSNLL